MVYEWWPRGAGDVSPRVIGGSDFFDDDDLSSSSSSRSLGMWKTAPGSTTNPTKEST
jgi:hypothetical protein